MSDRSRWARRRCNHAHQPVLLNLAIGFMSVCLLLGCDRSGEPSPAPVTQPPPVLASPTPSPVASPSPAPTVVDRPALLAEMAPPNLAARQAQALDLINQSRTEAGLSPVAWDPASAELAQAHAEDMLLGPYFSHWNQAGYGPDHRAALDAGMTDAVFENIHAFWRTSNGQPAPIQDWPQRVLHAHLGLMDSPGHRRNILDPAHTHVGVGIAYRADIGEMRLVQEFVNRYVELDPLPAELPVGAEVEISGRLLDGATDTLINLAFEPFPQSLSLEQLAETSTYTPAAEFFERAAHHRRGRPFQHTRPSRLRWPTRPLPHLGLRHRPGRAYLGIFSDCSRALTRFYDLCHRRHGRLPGIMHRRLGLKRPNQADQLVVTFDSRCLF